MPESNPPATRRVIGGTAGRLEHYGRDLAVGERIGNYSIVKLRSRGGFATIYQAKHVPLGRQVAIKVLHNFLCETRNMVMRFIQEAQAVNLIRHPNIVDIHEYGELADGRPFFVMEWLEGEDLESILEHRGVMSPNEALALMEDLCAALTAAHAAGVIHRDLKASNVVLVPSGAWYQVKLVDFGIAKLLDQEGEGRGVTSTGLRLGTPWNMAPEQIRGEAVDARADVYALGILLYQILTLELPFRAETPAEVEEQHLKAPPPHVNDRVPVTRTVDAVIQRALEKSPAARYESVQSFLGDLRRAVAGPPHSSEANTMFPAIGLHLEAHLSSDMELIDEAALDALDGAMTEVRQALAEAGFLLAMDTASAMTGVRVLSESDAALVQQSKLAALDLALGLRERLASDVAASLAISLHTATVITRAQAEDIRLVGGELLCVSQWTAHSAPGTLIATDELVAGLDGQLRLASQPPAPGFVQVLGRT